MLVYRPNAGTEGSARDLLDELVVAAAGLASTNHPQHDRVVGLLVDAGILESAVADAGYDGSERILPLTIVLHRLTRAIGHACVASWDRDERKCREWISHAVAQAKRIEVDALPERVTYRAPEGYAYYGLYPESYVECARQIWADRRPRHAITLGIRSIGVSLGGIVSAALEQRGCGVTSWSVRPVGHPFDRRVHLSPELAASLLSHPVDLALVVDEGPGLSGSSFAAAADVLATLGVPRDKTVLLPAWVPDGETFVSARARDSWRMIAKAHVPFERTWVESGRLAAAFGADSVEDLSAGAWRARWMAGREHAWPAIQPQHERRKYLARSHAGHRRVLKFAGLGRFGQRLLARAHALHGTAAAIDHLELTAGFLARPELHGQELSPSALAGKGPQQLFAIADYLIEIARRFRTGTAADMSTLIEMMRVNADEALAGAPAPHLRTLADAAARWIDVAAVLLDNRVFPHEWLATDRGLVKVDALEHHDDHFFPGPHDIAWDVAAVAVEFGIDGELERSLVDRVASGLGDDQLHARIPFFRAAYLAFRAGYCTVGATALGATADAERLGAASARYAQSLRAQSI